MFNRYRYVKISTVMILLSGFVFIPGRALSDSIPIIGLVADNEGGVAWNADGTGPEPANTGHQTYWLDDPNDPNDWYVALYYFASRDYIVSGSPGAVEGTGEIDGFPHFAGALQTNGFTIDQLSIKFGLMSLGNDLEGQDWTYDPNTHIETRIYTGGTYTLVLNGEEMVGGEMPPFTVIINYHNLDDPYDDEINGFSGFTIPADQSQSSSPAVQSAAAAFLNDMNDEGFRLVFYSLQPTGGLGDFGGNGRTGAFFDAQNGVLEISETEETDLDLQTEVTPEYISYLQTREMEYLLQLAEAANDEPTMKALMGLALINLAWNYIDTDSSSENLDSLLNEIFFLYGGMYYEVQDNLFILLDGVDSLQGLVYNLISYIEAGNISAFKATMAALKDGIDSTSGVFSDSLSEFTDRWFANLEEAGFYLSALLDSTADFTFTFTLQGTEYEDSTFVVNREFMDQLETTVNQAETSFVYFNAGLTGLDSIFQTAGGDVTPAIDALRTGLDEFDLFLGMASDLSGMQPLSVLGIDTTLFDSVAMVVAEIDTLLGGKEYPFGPEEDLRAIVPVAVLEAIPFGLDQVFLAFYWNSNDPLTYTFHGIFPYGLPTDLVNLLLDDITLSLFTDREILDSEVALQRIYFEWMLSDYPPPLGDGDPSNNGDAHFGLAMLDAYEVLRELEMNLLRMFMFLSEGNLDSAALNYDPSMFDVSEQLASVQAHLDAILEDEYYTVFVILVKTEEDEYADFIVDEGSEFYPHMFGEDQIAGMAESLETFRTNLEIAQMTIETAWDTLDAIMDINLDPYYLDFSEAENDSDIILILEAANPDFLTLTPYGVQKFHEMGSVIESVTLELATTMDELYFLIDTLSLYQDSLNTDFSEALFVLGLSDSVLWEIHEDFAYPDSTICFDYERVNLSAWFDNPPESFLTMWKNYVWGVDSTLGGLFPDRRVVSTDGQIYQLPRNFVLYQNYPNPFNPGTYIIYDIPSRSYVKLDIYDLLGKKVETLIDIEQNPGRKVIYWDASALPSGTYFYRLTTDHHSFVKKMILLK